MTEYVDGNRLTLLESGREYFPALEAACDAAVREIHVETYIYEDDEAGQRIAAALMRAARRGVSTHLLVDGYGSKKLPAALIAKLRDAGVKFLFYRPDIAGWRAPRQRLRRMHRKLAVIDARVAFVGGINIIDDMHTPGHTPPRFDYAVKIEGPLLEVMHPVVKRLWTIVLLTQLGGGWPDYEDVEPDTAPRGAQRAAFLVRDNLWHRNDIEEEYLAAIGRARSEILIASRSDEESDLTRSSLRRAQRGQRIPDRASDVTRTRIRLSRNPTAKDCSGGRNARAPTSDAS